MIRPVAPSPAPAAGRAIVSRRHTVAAVLILLFGAWLRMQHLDAGVPYALGVDEGQIMVRAVAMMKSGDFNPHFFDWPSLTIYAHLVVSCIVFLTGAMGGAWNHLDAVDPTHMYHAGRWLTAIVGSATVWLTWLAAKRWGAPQGIVAAALMAVAPYHVRESHYVLADVPAAFFTALTLLLALRALELGTLARYALAGAAAGLAASSKYNGGMVVLLPLLAAGFDRGMASQRLARAGVVCAAAMAAFLAGTPYAVLDLPAFLNDYARLANIFATERPGEAGWSVYLKHLRLALGTAGFGLALAGLLFTWWRTVAGPRRLPWLMLALFPPLYFHVMAGSYQIYGRYLLPLLPFACVLAAVVLVPAVAVAVRRLRIRGAAAAAALPVLVLLVLAVPARNSIEFNTRLGRTGTMDQAYDWISRHVPLGSRFVVERNALTLPPQRYPSAIVPLLIVRTFEDYRADQVDYLVASADGYGIPLATPGSPDYTAYRTLFTLAEEVATFTPSETVHGAELKILRVPR